MEKIMISKSIILNKLLDKYEKSKSLVTNSNRRITLKLDKMKEYDIENYQAKKLFHDIIFDLERKGLIFYSWKNHEKRKFVKRNMVK